MLTFHSYHFQPDTLTQIRECQSNNRDFAPAPSDTVQSHPPSSASSSPGRIRTHRSFQHHRQSSTSGTPLPLSLRHRIRPQAQAQAQGTSSSPPSTTSSPNQNHPATFLPYPLLSIDPTSLRMSRPTSSSATSRPTHIPLPNNNFTPTGTPLATPPIGTAASPASPRHSFLGFMRTRGRANTLNASQAPAVPPSPSLDRSRNASSREGSAGPHMSRETTTGAATGGSVTRSISTPLSGGGLNISTNTNANVNTNGNGGE
ncbi:hypothetical protein I302_107405 [Kwoniella bestiolae CBS 10118]|uniref:Uncharacterized protein n=1 Tax=Kwoniella bestiolae CBS 10118 TaxID=1296100 RepID=A0A1B9FYP0_9TREE|nr:hypothetical protein I302_06855 [Kwoniella bestiolae CBS 10118]OCF23870.1 hypothetical protein I302_06855 [Kwoniella bestiolae CBS 10118]